MSSRRREPLGPYVIAWIVLLVLLGLSIVGAYQPLGAWHALLSFGIAATQTAIVFIVFMKLRGRPHLKWLFAAAGFFWLLFLFSLSAIDYATRNGFPTH
ncbi:MAG TPA: hypothetical protein VMG11_01195 [Steroidobacteraceae bacterium]|nr:hypothetical protein [Steroidobacteraceae bacterium]